MPLVFKTSNSIYTIGSLNVVLPVIATAITNLLSSSVTDTGFTINWSGGIGNLTNTFYTINGITILPSSQGIGTATFSNINTSTYGKYWILIISVTNGAGTVTNTLGIYPLPAAIIHWKFDLGEFGASTMYADSNNSATLYQITNWGTGLSYQVGVNSIVEYNTGALITTSYVFGNACYATQSQGGGNKAIYLESPLSPPGYSTGGGYTFTGWYNMTGFGNVFTWYNYGTSPNSVYLMNLMVNSGSITANFGNNSLTLGTNYVTNSGSSTTINGGTWYYIAVVVNYLSTTQSNFVIYTSPQGSGAPTSALYTSPTLNFQPWNWAALFGLSQSQGGTNFSCDDFRYYNSALPLPNIQNIYSGTTTAASTATVITSSTIPVIWWKFDVGELGPSTIMADPHNSAILYQLTNWGSGLSNQVGVSSIMQYNTGALITTSYVFGNACYATQSQGGGNKAIYLDGPLSPPGYSTGGGYTFTGWYNMTGFGNVFTWYNYGASPNSVYLMNLMVNSGSITANFGNNSLTLGTNYVTNSGSSTTINGGTWYYIAVVVNYLSTTQSNFVIYTSPQGSGAPSSVLYTSPTLSFQPWNWAASFGLSQNQGGTNFSCDDFRYYNSALSLSRIQTIYTGVA
jgi:hypothetical protein